MLVITKLTDPEYFLKLAGDYYYNSPELPGRWMGTRCHCLQSAAETAEMPQQFPIWDEEGQKENLSDDDSYSD